MRDLFKAIPLGLGLPVMIGAASVKPEDAASNVAAWLHLLGIEHVPAWLNAPGVDNKVIVTALGAGAIYGLFIWGVPALRRSQAVDLIPLHEAARLVYEGIEKAGIADWTFSPTAPAETKLGHFKLLFVVDDETKLWGVRPPSTQSLPIPKIETEHLYPSDGEVSELSTGLALDSPTYVNVTVLRKDVSRLIKSYIAEAKQFAGR